MSDDLAQSLREATGAADPLRVAVFSEGDPAPLQHEFKYPFAVIGRGEGCDILLQDPQVSYRHAYLQVIEGRVFCVDLASRNGVFWPDGPRKYGWIAPDEPIRIGGYTLQLVGDAAKDRALRKSLNDLNPLENYGGEVGPVPKVVLEFRPEIAQTPIWPVNRLLTLIGRGTICKLRFESPVVSAVHCALLLTRQGLWAIDLKGRGGTQVDGQNVRAVPLVSGNEITLGNFNITVYHEAASDLASAERLTDNAAESETSMDDLESSYSQNDPPAKPAPTKPDAAEPKAAKQAAAKPESIKPDPVQPDPAKAGALDWTGSLFQIDGDCDTLVVMPLLEGHGFRYQQLHVESNALQRKFEMDLFVNLIVDLQHLNYFGSELIGALIRMARTVTDDSGRAAFCSPSPRMREVFEGMRLNKLWPIYGSRDEALQYVKEKPSQ